MPRGWSAGSGKSCWMRLLFLLGGAWLTGAAAAAESWDYVYNAPESALDRRYLYHWKILETALEKTRAEHGGFRLAAAEFMTEKRQEFELRAATGKLTVMYRGTTPEMEQNLVPIRIPVDKNLGGYCVFLIRKENQARFAPVATLDALRQFKFGLGLGWIDVDILRSNRFQVVTGSSYDGLFEMTVNRRFDVFLRAAVEVLDEYDQRHEALPDLAIEERLVLYYPMPMYFWFSRTDAGRRLAARAETGMRRMLDDGTYDRVFREYQQHKIERLQLGRRQILRIENPFLGPETPFHDHRLWYVPEAPLAGRPGG